MKYIQPKIMKHPQPVFHFLAVSVFEWRAGTDLHALMQAMDTGKQTYWVWYVPTNSQQHYDINFYQPQVEGSFVLAEVEFDKRGRRVTTKEGVEA